MIRKYGVYVRVFGQDVNYQIIHVSPCYFLTSKATYQMRMAFGLEMEDGSLILACIINRSRW